MIDLLTQVVPTNTDTPASILAAVIWLGGIIVGGLLFALRSVFQDLRLERARNENLRKESSETVQKLLTDSLTVAIDSTARVKESEKTIESAMTLMHQVAGQRPSGEQMLELNLNLRELRDIKNRGGGR